MVESVMIKNRLILGSFLAIIGLTMTIWSLYILLPAVLDSTVSIMNFKYLAVAITVGSFLTVFAVHYATSGGKEEDRLMKND